MFSMMSERDKQKTQQKSDLLKRVYKIEYRHRNPILFVDTFKIEHERDERKLCKVKRQTSTRQKHEHSEKFLDFLSLFLLTTDYMSIHYSHHY